MLQSVVRSCIKSLLVGSASILGITTSSHVFASSSDVAALGMTNGKTGTVSTYRDTNGKWQLASANLVRIHRSEDLDEMCLLIEPQVTNLCTNQKFNVTATTNITKGGDAASVLSVANDETAVSLIAASDLSDMITNDALFLLDNTAGVTDATATFGGTTGSTSLTSLSVFAAGGAAGVNGAFGLAGHAVQTDIIGTALVRYKQQGVTPGATTDQMVITVAAGKKVYFIVNQMEVFHSCTSPIYSTSAASVTRNRDAITAPYSGPSSVGGYCVNFYSPRPGYSNNGIFSLADSGGGGANSMGIRTITPRPMLEGQVQTNSGDDSTNDIGGIIPTRKNWAGQYWDETTAVTFGPNLRFNRVNRESFTADLTEMWFGKDRELGSHGFVEIYELVLVTSGIPTLNDIADIIIPTNAIAILAAGQSNMRVYGRDETSGSQRNEGELAIVSQLQSLYPSATPFWLDTAVSGTNLDDDPSGPSWMKINGGNFQDGEYLALALEQANAFARKGRIISHDWNQGENDQGGLTVSQWKERLKYILDRLRTTQSAPCVLIPPANRSTVAAGYITWREAFRQLEEENEYIYHSPETAWVTMDATSNNLHIASAGTVEFAPYIARLSAALDGEAVTGGVFGPKAHYIERDGTSVYVGWEHDAGTTLTPVSGIQGAVFTDAGTPLTISAHVVENDFTTKITLAGTPSGAEELYYGYGTTSDVSDYDDLIYDDSSNVLPARFFQHTLPYAKYAPDQFTGLMVWQDSNISTTASQRDDLSGNNRHCIQAVSGQQPTINVASQFNKDSVLYDASNDYYSITADSEMQTISDEITIEFIIKGTPSAGFKVLARNDFATTGWIIQNDSNGGNGSVLNRLFAKITTDAGSTTLATRIDGVFDGNIHHIIFRINNGQVDCFKDGTKISMGTYSVGSNGFASVSNWQIGGGTNLNEWMWNAYSRALSDEECAQKWEYARARWQIT